LNRYFTAIICLLIASFGILSSPNLYGQTKDSGVIMRPAKTAGGPEIDSGGKTRIIRADTIRKPLQPWQPNPKKAGLYSALLPGMGQLYNRQYWKIPIVYAALGTAGYVLIKNLNLYQSYRKAYLGRINNPYPTDEFVNPDGSLIYTRDQLEQLQNDYNRYVNLTVLFGSLGYALQVLDAITSAHLKNFDISRDISMQLKPSVTPKGIGFGVAFNLR
jgi:hypothetical protein